MPLEDKILDQIGFFFEERFLRSGNDQRRGIFRHIRLLKEKDLFDLIGELLEVVLDFGESRFFGLFNVGFAVSPGPW